MEVYFFLTLFWLAVIVWGVVCIIKPQFAWKRSFFNSKVREPNEGDVLFMKLTGVFYIVSFTGFYIYIILSI